VQISLHISICFSQANSFCTAQPFQGSSLPTFLISQFATWDLPCMLQRYMPFIFPFLFTPLRIVLRGAFHLFVLRLFAA
jgi:hypothetical protein